MKAAIKFFSLLASLAVWGCITDTERTAGGEDFPNSLGAMVSNNLAAHKEWNLLDSVPRQLPGSDVNIPTAPPGTESGSPVLGKIGAGGLQLKSTSGQPLAKTGQYFIDPTLTDTTILEVIGDTSFTYSQKVIQDDPKYNFGAIRRDTLVLIAKDTIAANHRIIRGYGSVFNILTGKRVASYRIEDADGNGMVHPVPGEVNQARYRHSLYLPLITRITEIILDAGPDLKFGEDGNAASKDDRIVSSSVTTTTIAGDTLEFVQWQDYDGDGFIHPNAETGKNRILMLDMKVNPLIKTRTVSRIVLDAGPDQNFDTKEDNLALSLEQTFLSASFDTLEYSRVTRPDGSGIPMHPSRKGPVAVDLFNLKRPLFKTPDRIESRVRMMIFPEDSTKNYPVKFSEMRSWQNGRNQVTHVFGMSPDSSFSPGDTVTVSIKVYPKWPQNVAERSVSYKAGLGNDIKKEEDNVLYSFVIAEERESGDINSLHFTFTPDKPIPSGQEPESGDLLLEVAYRDGTDAWIKGRLDNGKMVVTFKSRDGKTGKTTLNLDGERLK